MWQYADYDGGQIFVKGDDHWKFRPDHFTEYDVDDLDWAIPLGLATRLTAKVKWDRMIDRMSRMAR